MANSSAYLEDCVITKNNKNGFVVFDSALKSRSCLYLSHCDVRGNLRGSFIEEKTDLQHGNHLPLNSTSDVISENRIEKRRNTDNDDNIDSNYNSVIVNRIDGIDKLNNIIKNDSSSNNYEQNAPTSSESREYSSSIVIIPERIFFVRKCIGDEEATIFFKKFEWFDPLNDIEVVVDDDEEYTDLVISLVTQNFQKELIKEKIVRHNTNLPRSASLTNINTTGNSKRKRVEDEDINFKENFDRLFGDYEKDFFEGIEVPDKKDLRKFEYERCSGVEKNNEIMRAVKREKHEGQREEMHQNHVTMKIEKI